MVGGGRPPSKGGGVRSKGACLEGGIRVGGKRLSVKGIQEEGFRQKSWCKEVGAVDGSPSPASGSKKVQLLNIEVNPEATVLELKAIPWESLHFDALPPCDPVVALLSESAASQPSGAVVMEDDDLLGSQADPAGIGSLAPSAAALETAPGGGPDVAMVVESPSGRPETEAAAVTGVRSEGVTAPGSMHCPRVPSRETMVSNDSFTAGNGRIHAVGNVRDRYAPGVIHVGSQPLTSAGPLLDADMAADSAYVDNATTSSSKPPANVWIRPPPSEVSYHFDLADISEDGVTVDVDEDDVSVNLAKLENALIGKMLGKPIPFFQLKHDLTRKWGKFGKFQLKLMGNNCFMCIFDSMLAVDGILSGGPWISFGSIIGVIRWSHEFSASSYTAFSSPLWVRFPNLPLPFWSDKNIIRIATMLGTPMWLDGHIHDWERSNYARVCVRMDLSKKLPPGVWIRSRFGRVFQRVEYEGITHLCYRCGVVGHTVTHCSSEVDLTAHSNLTKVGPSSHSTIPSSIVNNAGSASKENAPSVDVSAGVSAAAASPSSPPTPSPSTTLVNSDTIMQDDHSLMASADPEEAAYGPWTLVSRKPRKARAARAPDPPSRTGTFVKDPTSNGIVGTSPVQQRIRIPSNRAPAPPVAPDRALPGTPRPNFSMVFERVAQMQRGSSSSTPHSISHNGGDNSPSVFNG